MSSKKSQIFISYSRANRTIAEQLTRVLEQQGLSVWVDYKTLKGGSTWEDEVENALRNADIFVTILSKESVNSNWVHAETGYALSLKKRIIPILVEDVRLPLNLSNIQYLDARKLRVDELGKTVAAAIEKRTK